MNEWTIQHLTFPYVFEIMFWNKSSSLSIWPPRIDKHSYTISTSVVSHKEQFNLFIDFNTKTQRIFSQSKLFHFQPHFFCLVPFLDWRIHIRQDNICGWIIGILMNEKICNFPPNSNSPCKENNVLKSSTSSLMLAVLCRIA